MTCPSQPRANEPLYGVKGVMARYDVHRDTVMNWRRMGMPVHFRGINRWLAYSDELETWFRANSRDFP